MKPHILAAVRDCKYCPSAALSNLAFYAAKRGEITLDDASVLFDEWSAETLYPPEKREIIINQIKMAILQATPIRGQPNDSLFREEELTE